MVKKNIHPKYREITVKMTDGTSFQTKSCAADNVEYLLAEVDIAKHPAWVEMNFLDSKDSINTNVKKFIQKFGDYDSLITK